MNLFGGHYESNIDRHPIHDNIAKFRILKDANIKDNDMKIFFTMDRFFFTDENDEIQFDTEFYEKTYDFTVRNNSYEFFRRYSMRIMSFHTFLMGEILPFNVTGIWKDTIIRYPFKSDFQNDFLLLDLRDNWECLVNDIEILDSKIKPESNLQKSLIWYTFGKLSQTKLERFMNFYRVFETLSNGFYNEKDEKLKAFIRSDLSMFVTDKINIRIPAGEKVRSFLRSQCIETQIISKIIDFRHKIAHGEDYALEFNTELDNTTKEMDDIISIIINRKIKSWGIKKFKNRSLVIDYMILMCMSKRKIILIDSNKYDCYVKENEDEWGIRIIIGRQTNENELEDSIFDMLNTGRNGNDKFDRQMCKNLMNSYGKIINY